MNARLAAVCVGRAATRGEAEGRPWRSAIGKLLVSGLVRVHRTGLAGDEQADLRVHGGPEKAVLAYAVAHYPAWSSELGLSLGPGAFGENLAVDGLDEATVAIGDVFAIGTARLQVAQPRAPCWKLARQLQRPEVVERVIQVGWSGWYLRVLLEGTLAAGDPVVRIEQPYPELTLVRLHDVLYGDAPDRGVARAFAACDALTEGLRERIAQKFV